jgi:hypothetical protein
MGDEYAGMAAVVEDIYPDTDKAVSTWEDELGGTTDLHDHVNDQSDSTYITFKIPMIDVCPTTDTESMDFGMESPSSTPIPGQSVVMRIRARKRFPIGGTGTMEATMRVRENSTQKAVSGTKTLTTSWAWYELVMGADEVASISDWADVECQTTFEGCSDGVDEEQHADVSQVEIQLQA